MEGVLHTRIMTGCGELGNTTKSALSNSPHNKNVNGSLLMGIFFLLYQ